MSAVASPPIARDELVSQPQREVTYTSYRDDLRLVKMARYPIRDAGGQKVGETDGVTVRFIRGLLRLPLEGDVVTEHGVKVPAPELIEWLESHRAFGDRFEGFLKVEVAAPPVSREEQDALVRASVSWDVETLEEMVEQERAGWNREEFAGSIVEAIREVRAAEARVRAEVEAEAAEKTKPKTNPAAK